MQDYLFETNEFGLSAGELHFLRSRFNYKTVPISDISFIAIKKGKQVKNWPIVLLIGLGLLCFGVFTAVKVIYEFFFADNFHNFYIEQFIIPVLPLIIGGYCLYYSLKSGHVLEIHFAGKRNVFPLEAIEKKERLPALKTFLQQNELTKDKFRPSFQD